MAPMSTFIDATHKVTGLPAKIPVAWLDTPLANAYVLVEAATDDCIDCDDRLAEQEPVQEPEPTPEPVAPTKKNRSSRE